MIWFDIYLYYLSLHVNFLHIFFMKICYSWQYQILCLLVLLNESSRKRLKCEAPCKNKRSFRPKILAIYLIHAFHLVAIVIASFQRKLDEMKDFWSNIVTYIVQMHVYNQVPSQFILHENEVVECPLILNTPQHLTNSNFKYFYIFIILV